MRSIGRRAAFGPMLALALGVGVIAAGCGGSDSSNGDALTRAELTSRATAICTPVADQVNAALGKVLGAAKPDSQAFAAAVTTTVLPQFEKQTDELAALKAPSELSDAYASYIDSAHGLATQLKADPAAPFSGDPTKFFGPSNEKAKAAGLPAVCLAGPSGG